MTNTSETEYFCDNFDYVLAFYVLILTYKCCRIVTEVQNSGGECFQTLAERKSVGIHA